MAIDIKPTDVILLEEERDKQKMQIMQLEHERDMFRSKFMELDRENEQLKREIENWMDSNKYNYEVSREGRKKHEQKNELLKDEVIKMLDEIIEEFQFPSWIFAIEMIIAEYHETEVPKHKRWKEKRKEKLNEVSKARNKKA
jgi:hypothetical protein